VRASRSYARSPCPAAPRKRFLFIDPQFRSPLPSRRPRVRRSAVHFDRYDQLSEGLAPSSYGPCWAHIGEGPGLNTRAFVVRASQTRAPVAERVDCRRACPASPYGSGFMAHGRFGRCSGCTAQVVFCGWCASRRARCAPCARQRRLHQRRDANRRYSTSEEGQRSGRKRQARLRARRSSRVTDATLISGSGPVTPSSPSRSEWSEPSRGPEISSHDRSKDSPSKRTLVDPSVRCARCGRVLSGFTRSSERPLHKRRRGPRHSFARSP
jgi:hypothetical protein